ncbi:MAG: hypothetical protein IPL71_04840 [Anaerolineales bacterium]|uniref:hypothetical protein n=1 Tax=Candidatus Villigracilis proximus TaxID=3140683 RepID=UPI0031358C3E|nr:hypothetical protein [Anaerolineales bacterium]
MKSGKLLYFLIAITLTFACAMGDLSTGYFIGTPTAKMTDFPDDTLLSTHTPTPTPAVLFSTPEALPFPAWVTDFPTQPLAHWMGAALIFMTNSRGLNRGWFYFIPGSRRGPFYAHLQEGTLIMQLPAENENKDYWVYNPKLIRKNFVLNFDFQFEETQPEDTVRVQFDQTIDRSVALDLSKNQTWALHWGSRDNWQSQTGTFDYLAPERITILIVMHGEQCAVYLNDDPLTYLDNCRTDATVRSSPWAVTFHILADPGHIAAASIDNLRLWDLDKIPNLAAPQ